MNNSKVAALYGDFIFIVEMISSWMPGGLKVRGLLSIVSIRVSSNNVTNAPSISKVFNDNESEGGYAGLLTEY